MIDLPFGAKKGVDDFIVAKGQSALDALYNTTVVLRLTRKNQRMIAENCNPYCFIMQWTHYDLSNQLCTSTQCII